MAGDFPGLAIFVAVFGFNLLGDGLRDVFDPQRGADMPPLLAIRDLHLMLRSFDGEAHVLNGVSLTVQRNEIWGLVGETGVRQIGDRPVRLAAAASAAGAVCTGRNSVRRP